MSRDRYLLHVTMTTGGGNFRLICGLLRCKFLFRDFYLSRLARYRNSRWRGSSQGQLVSGGIRRTRGLECGGADVGIGSPWRRLGNFRCRAAGSSGRRHAAASLGGRMAATAAGHRRAAGPPGAGGHPSSATGADIAACLEARVPCAGCRRNRCVGPCRGICPHDRAIVSRLVGRPARAASRALA